MRPTRPTRTKSTKLHEANTNAIYALVWLLLLRIVDAAAVVCWLSEPKLKYNHLCDDIVCESEAKVNTCNAFTECVSLALNAAVEKRMNCY